MLCTYKSEAAKDDENLRPLTNPSVGNPLWFDGFSDHASRLSGYTTLTALHTYVCTYIRTYRRQIACRPLRTRGPLIVTRNARNEKLNFYHGCFRRVYVCITYYIYDSYCSPRDWWIRLSIVFCSVAVSSSSLNVFPRLRVDYPPAIPLLACSYPNITSLGYIEAL